MKKGIARIGLITMMFTVCWGAGTILGPLMVGIGMDQYGANKMALIICLLYVFYLPLPVLSYFRSRHRSISAPS